MNDLMQLNPYIRYAMEQKRFYYRPETHMPYDCRLFFLVAGAINFTIGDDTYEMTPSASLFIPPAQPYRIAMDTATNVRLMVYNFDCECTGDNAPHSIGTAVPENFNAALVRPARLFAPFDRTLYCPDVPELRAGCERIIDLFQTQRDRYREWASMELKTVLLQIERHRRLSGCRYLKLIGDIKEYIQAHAREDISNETVAKHFGYHSYYLNRLLRQYDETTITQLIIRYRLQYAEACMVSTDMTIAEIAAEAGFPNISYFSRLFKEKVGVSPNQYRRTFSA